ncbi:hypothetical protein SynRS9902_00521 [Synechococcus sp. RS9902]|nr:hypothetical protein SynRS9902_00521 [Synechococcus sp. RS9902]
MPKEPATLHRQDQARDDLQRLAAAGATQLQSTTLLVVDSWVSTEEVR